MHPIEACIRNPVKVSVAVLIVVLFGGISLFRMPMQLTPEVQIPTISLQTRWPGASPQEVEQEIIQEQEIQLKSVEGVMKMTSESSDSSGSITLEFNDGTDMGEALLKVNSRLQQVREYPEDADEPVISTSDSADSPIAWFILSPVMTPLDDLLAFQKQYPQWASLLAPVVEAYPHNSGLAMLRLRNLVRDHPEIVELQSLAPPDIDVEKMRKFCEDVIEARFERIDGVSNSNVIGGRDPELRVTVNPHQLAARQLTILDIRNALREQNKDTSGGDFWEGKRRYVVRTMGQFRSIAQVEGQVIAVRGGIPVYVRDVAEVSLSYKKPTGFVRRFGANSIAINAQRDHGANVLEVMRELRLANQELNAGLLKDQQLLLTQVYDQTDYIYSAMGLVNTNMLFGGLLTIGVLLVFLRSGRSTFVIALAIPICLISTFLVLHLLGRSLNVISLAGLAFAVGMLVDNAVVVLENIHRHYQRGEAPFQAAELATKEVWGAVIASTLTTLAVFLPVLFIEEEAGQLFRDIALAISAAVAASLLVSVTVIPTATARLLSARRLNGADPGNANATLADEKIASENGASQQNAAPRPTHWLAGLDRFGAAFVESVVGINRWIQQAMWRKLTVVALLVGVSIGASWALRPQVEYLPTGNRNLVFGIILPPPGYNLDQLAKLGQTVEDELRPYWDIDPASPEAAKLPYPVIGDFFYVARGRSVFLGVRAADPTKAAKLLPLISKVGAKLPGAFIFASQSSLFGRGLSAGRTIDVEITGPEIEELVSLGGRIIGEVRQVVPQAQTRPVPSLDLSSPEIHVIPKLLQAAEMGIRNADIGYTVDALVDGAYVTDYFIGGDKIDLVIMGDEQYAQRTQDLEALPIATPGGQLIPLAALATVVLSSGPEQINHRERQRAITIEVSPPENISLEAAIASIQREILTPLRQSGGLKPGYNINLSGTADKLRDTWDALKWNVVLALLITYLLMAALFESWAYPLVIIFTVPLGAVGGIAGLKFLGYYLQLRGEPAQMLDVLTMLGFVILIGTVVNNAILIVHQSLNLMRNDGMAPRLAILESVRTRIRPIFMTTTTTVLGLAPLVFFPGAGSELYRGLGAVVLGGLLVSTVFTLVLAPTLFSLMLDFKDWRQGPANPPAPEQAIAAQPQQIVVSPAAVGVNIDPDINDR